ncbi:hypothetical protein K8I28_13385 [bacterium]|nr:hypothetical protein [bacterium]
MRRSPFNPSSLTGIFLAALLLFAVMGSGCLAPTSSVKQEPVTQDSATVQHPDTSIKAPLLPIEADSTSKLKQSDSLLIPDTTKIDSTYGGGVADSLQRAIIDSVMNAGKATEDTAAIDSAAIAVEPEKKKSDIDTTISYSAEDISFNVRKKTTTLKGNAKIIYKDITLTAHQIIVDWENDLMTATGSQDTVWTDSSNTEIDSIVQRGVPSFKEKQQVMTGSMMRVNMKTRQGYVVDGRTMQGDGYYYGVEIQKASDEILYVRDGSFTSCELDDPHYSFTGNKMKMIVRERVVGKPVVLRFDGVPVAALPFGVFSLERGRHSGVLIPTYGDNSSQGRHFRNLGYYLAVSDYWDAKAMLDFYEKLGILVRGDFAYKKRYRYNGGLSGSLVNQNVAGGGGRQQRWDLQLQHNQDINETTKLRAKGNFVSDGSYYSDVSNNQDRRLDQKIRSDATLTKSFPGTRSSATMNLSHEENLATGENSQTLPSLSYRLSTAPIFPSKQQREREDKNLIYEPPEPEVEEEDEDDEERWYNQITFGYNARLNNQRREDLVSEVLEEQYRSGITHSISINAPQKVMRYINVNPSLSYSEDWFNERRNWYYGGEGELKYIQERGFFQRRTFNAGINTTTKMYGYFNINKGPLKVIRHVLTPTIGLNYRPDFSTPVWGYYQDLKYVGKVYDDPTNPDSSDFYYDVLSAVRQDRYTGSIFGGTSRGKQMALRFSLNNLFQMKTVKLNDKNEEEEVKTDLFTYNLSTNYNFAADSLKFAPLSSSFRANPISSKNKIGPLEKLSIDVSTNHSFYRYAYNEENGRGNEINKFYWEEEGHGFNIVRLTNFSTTSSFTLSGKSPFSRVRQREAEALGAEDGVGGDPNDLPDINQDFDSRFSPFESASSSSMSGKAPWRLSGSLRYTLNMRDPRNYNESLRLSGTMAVTLTKKWSFSYASGVDLISRDIISSNLSVTRDLHCWEGRFSWSPMGIGKGFYLRIGIKSSQLSDVKLEQKRGRSGGSIGSGLGF